VNRDAGQFREDYKIFYCREDEPTYIKNSKIKILTNLAETGNLGNILNELGEYAH
jgi:vesicle coat complex subunit